MSETPKAETENGRGIPQNSVRAMLGLAVWQLRLATDIGLIRKHPKSGYLPEDINKAVDDLVSFAKKLDSETLLNATDAATRMGVTTSRFTAAADAAGLEVRKTEPWKYGNIIRYWKAADVDLLAGDLVIDSARRAVTTAIGRTAAVKKAAETRARNKVIAVDMTAQIDKLAPLSSLHPTSLVIWSAAMELAFTRGAGLGPSGLESFFKIRDVKELAQKFTQARPNAVKIAEWSAPEADIASAVEGVIRVKQAAHLIGVLPAALLEILPHAGSYVSKADVETVLEHRSEWLTGARFDKLAAMDRLFDERHEAKRAEKDAAKAEEDAWRAEKKSKREWDKAKESVLTVDLLAEMWSIPVELILAMVPRRGWRLVSIENAIRSRPAWALNLGTAQAAADSRTSKRKRNRAAAGESDEA
jgi:hypothetical protein